MAEPGTIAGARGQITYAYHTAAIVTNYVLTLRARTVTGTITESNPYLLTQTPLVFVTRVGRWPVEAVTVTGTQIQARLGAPVLVGG
jgi:hypothetical protein